jgi:hypothetical protein
MKIAWGIAVPKYKINEAEAKGKRKITNLCKSFLNSLAVSAAGSKIKIERKGITYLK